MALYVGWYVYFSVWVCCAKKNLATGTELVFPVLLQASHDRGVRADTGVDDGRTRGGRSAARKNEDSLEGHRGRSEDGHTTWDRCYDFLNIFAEKFFEKIGVFDSKQS
jgi:hypothetical protein